MIDIRHRPPVTSASSLPAISSMPRRSGASVRSMSSGSMTPMEDEEDRPKRSTRGRNPLPPTKGPLFPPLPPKPVRAKSDPKASQPSEAGTARTQPDAGEQEDQEGDGAEAGPSEQAVQSAGSLQPAAELKVETDKPSWSDRSLTPAPPSSDNVEVVVEAFGKPVNGSHRRARRGSALGIKIEVGDSGANGDDEEGAEVDHTPKQPRVTRGRLAPPASAGTTPTGSVMSDQGANGNGPRGSLGRRRRGEEQLLLDDHLLPVEIRRTGSLSGRRKSHAPDTAEQQEEEIDVIEVDAEGEVEDAEEEKVVDVVDEEDDAPVAEVEVENGIDPPSGDDIIEQDLVDPDEEEPEEGDGEEVTRCVCQLEDGDPLMVACDKCNVWQHGPCVGIWADEEAPDEYFCERCRPELHGPLRKWMRSKGRNIAHFAPPMPEDLKHLHSHGDRYPPSQSKRWIASGSKAKIAPRGRKEAVSPIESSDPRRLSRRGDAPTKPTPTAPVSHREKSAKAEPPRPAPSREHRRGSSHHRKASIGSRSPVRESGSPTAMVNGTKDRETRKRSTMNSRDAAFEDAVQAAIEASRREMGDEGEEGEGDEAVVIDDAEEGEEEKDKEVEKKNKGKRKREEEIDPDNPLSIHSSSHGKIKHPNQYTYRSKPTSAVVPAPPPAPSPARRPPQSNTPAPQIPPPALHEHGTRRAGALANGAREAPFIAVSVSHLGWHLPDYLSSFADIFPHPNPTPLQVRSPRTLPPMPKNHFLNHRYGPFSEDRDGEEGKGELVLPPDPVEREAMGQKGETHAEPPARMKYPQRRVTTGEMRKRVRHMLEFCGRVEVEEGRRRERKGKLGIPDAVLEHDGDDVEDGKDREGVMEVDMENGHLPQSKPPTPASPTPKPTSTSSGPTAAQLLAELTADLVDFQDTWARGGFAPTTSSTSTLAGPSNSATTTNGWGAAGGYGGYSPVPPGSATFAQNGNGWPTSGLGRDVVGPEDFEEFGGTAEGGQSSVSTDEAVPTEGAPVGGGENEEEGMEVPVDVYREGQVTGVISTVEEDEAAQRIEDNAAREEGRAAAEADVEGDELPRGKQRLMEHFRAAEALPTDFADEGSELEPDVDADGVADVVMAE